MPRPVCTVNIYLDQSVSLLLAHRIIGYFHIALDNSSINKISLVTFVPIIKFFSCSTQLSMKFVMLINLKVLTIANSFLLNIAVHEIFSAIKYENANNSWRFHIY